MHEVGRKDSNQIRVAAIALQLLAFGICCIGHGMDLQHTTSLSFSASDVDGEFLLLITKA